MATFTDAFPAGVPQLTWTRIENTIDWVGNAGGWMQAGTGAQSTALITMRCNSDTTGLDMESSADLWLDRSAAGLSAVDAAVWVRKDSTTTKNGYEANVNFDHTNAWVLLNRVINGTRTTLITFSTLGVWDVTARTLKLRATGSGASVHLEVFVNGTSIGTFDDANAARVVTGTRGCILLHAGQSGAAVAVADNFVLADFIAGNAAATLAAGTGAAKNATVTVVGSITSGTRVESGTTTDTGGYASVSFAPVGVGNLILMFFVHSYATTPGDLTAVGSSATCITGQTKLGSIAYGTIAAPTQKAEIWAALTTATPSTIGMSLPAAATGIMWCFQEFLNVDTTKGVLGTRGLVTNRADAGTVMSLTLGAFQNGANGAAVVFGCDSFNQTNVEKAGWNVASQRALITPNSSNDVMWIGSNDTTPSSTLSLAGNWGGVGVELWSVNATTLVQSVTGGILNVHMV